MAFSRINLCLNPALKNGEDPSWRFPVGWVRSTGLHATLPRQTGMAGTAAGTVSSGPAGVVPGRTYVGSISMRAVAANSGTVGFIWADRTGVALAPGPTNPYTQGANTTARVTTPASVAPAGAAYCRVSVGGIDGSMQLTAALVEQVNATGGTYFDGDDVGSGAAWAGPDGASPSIIGTSDLTAAVSYDAELGRIRVLATGGAPMAGGMQVLRRTVVSNAFEQVRGTPVPMQGGASARSGDDYEYPVGLDLVYRLETRSGAEDVPATVASVESMMIERREAFFVPPTGRAWLKFVAAPSLNRKVTIVGWDDISRPSRNSLYEVRERPNPVIITAGHSSRRVTIRTRTFAVEETEALDHSLKQGIPGLLHLPVGYPLPNMYVVFGDYKYEKPSRRSQGAIFTIPLIEVDAPPPSIYGTGTTWATVLAAHATWADLLASAPTWQAVQ